MKNNFYINKMQMSIKKLAMGTSLLFLSTLISLAQPGYIAGDFHQHTTFTDGSYSFDYVMNKNAEFDLDWWTNSEHGGYRYKDGRYSGLDLDTTVYYDIQGLSIAGDTIYSGGHQAMWRWQILKDYSFNSVLKARKKYSDKQIIQGVEWNVPGHEHASVSILTGQFGRHANANAIAEFEYKFDNSDRDVSGGAALGWVKSELSGHEKTLEAISWLQENHQYGSWVIPAHPERASAYNISHFRDMNNAGPDVCFGFESMPGHQLSSNRGGYRPTSAGAGTYGGCGYYAAKIGGLWDAMLSEGRNWWLFANSDFHSTSGDFYPGEYQKTYTYVRNKKRPQSIFNGLRSGNSWIVEGDLIDYLDFKVFGYGRASMGETITMHKDQVWVRVILNDPETENNFGDNPTLDHVDLIMGQVNGLIDPSSSDYNAGEVSTTKVIARFDANGGISDENGITSIAWRKLGRSGKIMIIYPVTNIDGSCYFRLRGTNKGLNELSETDANGNPLLDVLGENTFDLVTNDLWFYSNPIFAEAYKKEGKSNRPCFKSAETTSEIAESDLEEINVYPNPVTDGYIMFSNMNFFETKANITIYNSAGVVVLSENITSDVVDINHLPVGVYTVKIDIDNNSKVLRVIKM